MSQQPQPLTFHERVARVRDQLIERLQTFRPGPGTYITAFCVGATIGEYAHAPALVVILVVYIFVPLMIIDYFTGKKRVALAF